MFSYQLNCVFKSLCVLKVVFNMYMMFVSSLMLIVNFRMYIRHTYSNSCYIYDQNSALIIYLKLTLSVIVVACALRQHCTKDMYK